MVNRARRFRLNAGLVLAALAGGCATMDGGGTNELRGCWIERRGGDTLTMRWFPDMDVLGAWRGDALLNAADGTTISAQLRLDRPDANWRICTIEGEVSLTTSCTPAFFGAAAPRPDEPWTEIYAGAETLRIRGRDAGGRVTVFNGARDGCD